MKKIALLVLFALVLVPATTWAAVTKIIIDDKEFVNELNDDGPLVTGLVWDSGDLELTLSSSYTSGDISVICGITDHVSLHCTGDISLSSSIACGGSLTIETSTSGDELTLNNSGNGPAIICSGDIYISSGEIHAIGGNAATPSVIFSQNGDVQINATVTVEPSPNVTNISGIKANGSAGNNGVIFIPSLGTVNVTTSGNGIALDAQTVNNSCSNVTLKTDYPYQSGATLSGTDSIDVESLTSNQGTQSGSGGAGGGTCSVFGPGFGLLVLALLALIKRR